MRRYERFAVLFDPDGAGLGAAALGLIERGIDPLYAKDFEEALQLAAEEERVGAFVLPGTLPPDALDTMIARITPALWAGAAAILVVAPPRERALMRMLRDRGVRWVLHAPYDEAELRFAVAAALASEDALEPRSGLRVPIRLGVTLRVAGEETPRTGTIRNLSLAGAYVAAFAPPEPGTAVVLEFGLGERSLRLVGTVVHRVLAPEPGRAEQEPGVGVRCDPPPEPERRLLEEFLRERIDSFRL